MGIPENSVPSTASCPLRFDLVPNPHASCFDPAADNFTISQCCYDTFVNFAFALAWHTNETHGELFLPADQELACAQEAQTKSLVTKNCEVAPPVFTANEGPCLFLTENDMVANLTLGVPSPITVASLTTACANVEQEGSCDACVQVFDNAEQKLISETGANASEANCRAALLVSVTSHNVSSQPWREALYTCLAIPFPQSDLTHSSGKSPHDHDMLLGTLLGLVFFLAVLAFLGYVKLRRRSKRDASEDEEDIKPSDYYGETVANEGTLYNFSARELIKATDSFSEKNFIGEGSAGKVYRGVLPSGQLVAIKLIMNEKKLETFYKEIENLSRVRHPNLVTLLGYCQTADQHLLVYEYCSKGNLWYYLFGGGPVLTWEQRINIAVGSARGIMHLHMNPGGYIVHRDIKPTNILLGESFNAKVSDFGLSRFIAIEESRVFTEIKGTAGYLDPEYLSMGTLTFSSDIYSFGIVLLQLISGRRPIDLDPKHRLSLVKMGTHVVTKGHLSELVDPQLEGVYSEAAFRKVTEIAVQSTSEVASNRPSIIEVRQAVEEALRLARQSSEEEDVNLPAILRPGERDPWFSSPDRSQDLAR